MRFHRLSLALICPLLGLGAAPLLTLADPASDSGPGQPQSSTENGSKDQLEEIIVQARLRDERLIDVPASITALSATTMAENGIQDVRAVGEFTPGLIVAPGVDDSTDRFFVRGIGTVTPTVGAEPSVPIYIDDIYTPSGIASNLNVFAFDRVEVLRGPQGTLYGRNSYGGAIKFYTRELTNESYGYVTAGFGNFDERDIKAEFGAPLINDKLWVAMGAASISHGGYQTDPFNGGVRGWALDEKIYKAKVQFDPIENLRFTLAYDDTRNDAPAKQPKITSIGSYVFNGGLQAQYPGIVPNLGQSSTNPDVIDTSVAGNEQVYAHGATWSARWKLNDDLTIKYLGSDRWLENIRLFDITGSASPFLLINEDFRLNGKTNEVQVNWSTQKITVVGGLFYYQEDTSAQDQSENGFYGFLDPNNIANIIIDGQGRPTTVNLGDYTPNVFSQEVRSKAAFMNGTYSFTDQWHLSAGLRWTEDNKTTAGSTGSIVYANGTLNTVFTNACFCVPAGATILATGYSPGLSATRVFPQTTPELVLDYKPSSSQLLYWSYKRGFQAGTIYPNANEVPGAALSTKAQTVDALEFGSKGIYFEDKVDLNLSLFYNRFNDLVVSVNTPVPITVSATGFAGLPQNAGAAHSDGIDLESRFKFTPQFALTANISYLDFKVTRVNSVQNGVTTNVAGTFLRPYSLAPSMQGNVGVEYNMPVSPDNNVRLFINDAFRSTMGINSANGAETSGIGLVASNPATNASFLSRGMSDVSGGGAFINNNGRWRLDVIGRNLFDVRRPVATIASVPNLFGAIQQWNAPRTWLVSVTHNF